MCERVDSYESNWFSGLNGLSGFNGLSRSDEESRLSPWDDEAEKPLPVRPPVVGAGGLSTGLRRKRFFKYSNMQGFLTRAAGGLS